MSGRHRPSTTVDGRRRVTAANCAHPRAEPSLFRRLGQIDGSARRAQHASDHRLERFERHRLEVGIKRRLIEHAAELFRLFEVGMAAKLFAHIAVKPNEVEEVIALEDAVMLHDPVIFLRDERFQKRGGDVGVIVRT
jgi:hypothetical protein